LRQIFISKAHFIFELNVIICKERSQINKGDFMTEDIIIKIYVWTIIGFVWGMSFFYDAYRIYKHKGVVTESRIGYITMFVISIFQFLLMERVDINPFLWYGILVCIFLLGLWFRFYFGGKTVTIYETKKELVIPIIEKQLKEMSIHYVEKDGFHTEESVYHLIDEDTKLNIDSGFIGDEIKDFRITFQKPWRSFRMEELQLRLIEEFREQRGNQLLWKQTIINVILGVGVIGALSYFLWSKMM
jgi:hypothetical protein